MNQSCLNKVKTKHAATETNVARQLGHLCRLHGPPVLAQLGGAVRSPRGVPAVQGAIIIY